MNLHVDEDGGGHQQLKAGIASFMFENKAKKTKIRPKNLKVDFSSEAKISNVRGFLELIGTLPTYSYMEPP